MHPLRNDPFETQLTRWFFRISVPNITITQDTRQLNLNLEEVLPDPEHVWSTRLTIKNIHEKKKSTRLFLFTLSIESLPSLLFDNLFHTALHVGKVEEAKNDSKFFTFCRINLKYGMFSFCVEPCTTRRCWVLRLLLNHCLFYLHNPQRCFSLQSSWRSSFFQNFRWVHDFSFFDE